MSTGRVEFLDLARQYQAVKGEVDRALARVLARGWYVLGEEVAGFEREFAASLGVGHCVGVNSGTDALTLALRACGVGPGDAVLTAANTAVPTVCAIVAAGATPWLVDVDPVTLCLDPEALRAELRNSGRPAPARGRPGAPCTDTPPRWVRSLEIARTHGLWVVEDADAQRTARCTRGGPRGRSGDAGCFSFYPTKNLGACGDAAAKVVVTNDPDLADCVVRLRNYGEEAKYRNRDRGVNSRLDELQAAARGEAPAPREGLAGARPGPARLYDETLAGHAPETPPRAAGLPAQPSPVRRPHARPRRSARP
ncbi:MAG: DegT/DnrJ/EryC1/StrS family aminotransferase [Isosphaeraceae bacterium]